MRKAHAGPVRGPLGFIHTTRRPARAESIDTATASAGTLAKPAPSSRHWSVTGRRHLRPSHR